MSVAGRWVIFGFAVVLGAPALAYAGNGTHPRTPVLWEPAPECLTIVDRTVDAKLTFNYTIPYEDTEPTADEVDDSRRHQFLAFCHGHSRQEPLPVWIAGADVTVSADKGLIDPADVKPEDVLETSTLWKDCWYRVTGDDERRPITFAEAAKPVVWDTSMLPVGPYVLAGYTWEPAFNTWWERSGVIKVIDDPDPAASPPALALSNGEEIKFSNEILTLRGCLSAMDGSTITGSWSRTDGESLDWQVFASDVPVSGEEFELDFTPPPESVGESIAFKVEITDPMDRRFTAHMDFLATILPGDDETGGCGDSGMSFIGDPNCGSSSGSSSEASGGAASSGGTGDSADLTGGSTGAAGSSGGSDETGPGEQPQGKDGCGCVAGGGAGSLSLSSLVLGLGLLLRRRRAA